MTNDWKKKLHDTMFEGTTPLGVHEQDPPIQPVFTLEIGEACQPNPDHLRELHEGQEFKILIRRVGQNRYWYLDVNGKQGEFHSEHLEFWRSQWEKVTLSSAQ